LQCCVDLPEHMHGILIGKQPWKPQTRAAIVMSRQHEQQRSRKMSSLIALRVSDPGGRSRQLDGLPVRACRTVTGASGSIARGWPD
jgi:hypothetical protein